jgi:hypothetical protein
MERLRFNHLKIYICVVIFGKLLIMGWEKGRGLIRCVCVALMWNVLVLAWKGGRGFYIFKVCREIFARESGIS